MEAKITKGKFSYKRTLRRHFISLALMLMREGGHFGKPENDGNFRVISKYVRFEEFCNRY